MASILRVNTLTDASSNNSTPMATVNQGTAKVWINFNGSGTIATRDSFNVTSITDNGTGDYYVTIATDMSDSNYSTTTAGRVSGNISCNDAGENTTGRLAIGALASGGSRDDPDTVCASVHGDTA